MNAIEAHINKLIATLYVVTCNMPITKPTIIVVPTIIVGLVMGILHVTTYSVAISLLIWASIAFMLFIVSYIARGRDSLPADTAHFLNNGIIDVNRGLAIVV